MVEFSILERCQARGKGVRSQARAHGGQAHARRGDETDAGNLAWAQKVRSSERQATAPDRDQRTAAGVLAETARDLGVDQAPCRTDQAGGDVEFRGGNLHRAARRPSIRAAALDDVDTEDARLEGVRRAAAEEQGVAAGHQILVVIDTSPPLALAAAVLAWMKPVFRISESAVMRMLPPLPFSRPFTDVVICEWSTGGSPAVMSMAPPFPSKAVVVMPLGSSWSVSLAVILMFPAATLPVDSVVIACRPFRRVMRGAVTVIEVGFSADATLASTLALFSMERWPAFESVRSFAATLTSPVCPEEFSAAAALIVVESPSAAACRQEP